MDPASFKKLMNLLQVAAKKGLSSGRGKPGCVSCLVAVRTQRRRTRKPLVLAAATSRLKGWRENAGFTYQDEFFPAKGLSNTVNATCVPLVSP